MILNVTFEQISADLQIDLDESSVEFPIQFDSDDNFEVDFGETTEIRPDDVPVYDGPHEINPTFTDQVLDTSGLLLEEDIKIESIPLVRVSNNSGGMTVIIGG